MAITVTNNLTNISNADSTTNWAIFGSATSIASDPDIKREGTASNNAKLSAARGGLAFSPASTFNFTNGAFYAWVLCTVNMSDTANTGGITIRLESSTTDWAEWQVTTGSNYSGGWQRYVVQDGVTANTNSGTFSKTAVNRVVIQFDITTSLMGNIKTLWVDTLDLLDRSSDSTKTAITVTGSVTTTGALFSEIESNSTQDPLGIVTQGTGVFLCQGPVRLGDIGTGSDTLTSQNETVVFSNQKVSNGFYELRFSGNSTGTNTHEWGTVTGSGDTAIGTSGTIILSAGPKWLLDASDANIDNFKLYGCTLKALTNCQFGSSSSALGTTGDTYHAVSNIISDLSGQLILNIGADTRNENANQIIGAGDADGSINIYDSTTIDTTDWKVIDGAGFESTATAGTRTITDHTFLNVSGSKPYISVQDSASAVWNMDDANDGSSGRPSITDQTELAFAGTSNGDINERYTITWSVKTPAGSAINAARVKIVETAPSVALANEGSTDSSGAATSTYLRALYEPNGAFSLTTTTHTPSAFKVYKYGKLPSVSSATINQPVTNNIALLDDSYYVTSTAATAITNGESGTAISIIEASTNEHSLIKFTGGSGGTLSDNDTITASGVSPATGQVVGKIIEGDSTAGTILLDNRNASTYDNGETLSNGGGWTATYTNDSEKRFHWIIDAGYAQSRTAQNVYDYLMAKLDEATADTSPTIDDLIMDGRAEFGTPFQGVSTSPNTFKTVRNAALTRGWAVANLNDLSEITQFTDNSDNAFTPASTVSVTVTVKDQSGAAIPGVQVAIFQDNATRTVVLASTSTDENGEVSTTVASSLGNIIIRTRQSTNIASFVTKDGINGTTEVITTNANHNFHNGDAVVYSRNGGSQDIGPEPGTYYINSTGATTLMLYDTAANAISGGGTGKQDLTQQLSNETHTLDPVRYVAASATGTIGATDFSAQITMVTDSIASG